MKINFELFDKILTGIPQYEGCANQLIVGNLIKIEGYDRDIIDYNCKRIHEAKFVHSSMSRGIIFFESLTPLGLEYLNKSYNLYNSENCKKVISFSHQKALSSRVAIDFDFIKKIVLYLGKNNDNLSLSEDNFFVKEKIENSITTYEINKFNDHSKFLLDIEFAEGYISKEKTDAERKPSVRLHSLRLDGNIYLYTCQSEDILGKI